MKALHVNLLGRWAFFALVGLTAGCSTLPVVSPDMAQASGDAVQLRASSGRVLSPQRSREIIERLSAGGTQTDVLTRHLALEQAIADGPLTLGNRAVLLQDGPATYEAMFAAIASRELRADPELAFVIMSSRPQLAQPPLTRLCL